jgi:hypothetical protein
MPITNPDQPNRKRFCFKLPIPLVEAGRQLAQKNARKVAEEVAIALETRLRQNRLWPPKNR